MPHFSGHGQPVELARPGAPLAGRRHDARRRHADSLWRCRARCIAPYAARAVAGRARRGGRRASARAGPPSRVALRAKWGDSALVGGTDASIGDGGGRDRRRRAPRLGRHRAGRARDEPRDDDGRARVAHAAARAARRGVHRTAAARPRRRRDRPGVRAAAARCRRSARRSATARDGRSSMRSRTRHAARRRGMRRRRRRTTTTGRRDAEQRCARRTCSGVRPSRVVVGLEFRGMRHASSTPARPAVRSHLNLALGFEL